MELLKCKSDYFSKEYKPQREEIMFRDKGMTGA